MTTFIDQFSEENARDLAAYYLVEAEKLRPSEELGNALAMIAGRRSGKALASIRRLVSDLENGPRPTLDQMANSAGYAYDVLQAYACLFISNQLEADRVLGTDRSEGPGTVHAFPSPFTGDIGDALHLSESDTD